MQKRLKIDYPKTKLSSVKLGGVMKKSQILSIIILGCAASLSIQSAYMFFDGTNLTNHLHYPDAALQSVNPNTFNPNEVLTAGDSSEAKIVFIEQFQPTPGGSIEYIVSYEVIHPKSKTFQTLADAQEFALALLQQSTRARLQEEALNQQKSYEQYASSTYSNRYLTGGRRNSKKRRYYSYRSS